MFTKSDQSTYCMWRLSLMFLVWIFVATFYLLAEADNSLNFFVSDDVIKGPVLTSAYNGKEKIEETWTFVDLRRNPTSFVFHVDNLFHLDFSHSMKLFPLFDNFWGQVVRVLHTFITSSSLSLVGQSIFSNLHSVIFTRFWFQRFRLQRQQSSQMIGTNTAANYHWATLDMSLVDNSPLFNATVILTVPPFDFMPGCSTNPNDNDCSSATVQFSWKYLAWIQHIVDEILFEAHYVASPIVVLLGYGTIESKTTNFGGTQTTGEKDATLEKRRQDIFDSQCEFLTTYVSSLAAQYTQFPQSAIVIDCVSVITPSGPVSMEDDKVPSNPGDLDVREFVAQYAYNQYNTDYYFFPDIDQSEDKLQQHGWLPALIRQFQQSSLYRNFGVVFFESSNLDAFVLVGPMLHREHFTIFSFSNEPKESELALQEGFFSYRKSKIENNLWLNHVYQAFAGSRSLFLRNVESNPFPYERMSDSVRHQQDVFKGREWLHQWLNQHVYSSNPIAPEYVHFENIISQTRYCWTSYDFSLPITFIQAMSDPFRNTLWQRLGLTELASLTSHLSPNVQIQVVANFSVKLAQDQAMPSVVDDADSVPEETNSKVVKTNGRVAVITAVFGSYEGTGKWHARQTIATDFFIFTDREDLIAPGWQVVTTPYHLQAFEDEARNETLKQQHNSLHRHSHPFNIAKFYKMQFHRIDLLQQYETVIWVDGTVSITDRDMSLKILDVFASDKEMASTSNTPPPLMVVFEHYRGGNVTEEGYMAALVPKYNTTNWLGFTTVPQMESIYEQLETYAANGFRQDVWPSLTTQAQGREQYGLWCTCFVAWDMTRPYETGLFLNHWYAENRRYSTQDQVSFPYVSQSLELYPHSLPDEKHQIFGGHDVNSLYIKWEHGM